MSATSDRRPALSVILITPDTYEAIRRVVDHLRAQRLRERIELVIVVPREAALELDPSALEGFFDWRVVEVEAIDHLGIAEAAGIRSARGNAVVYVEEHSFPQPGWAEALIRAHEETWAAVGPAMTNANPRTMSSWVSFLLDFGQWVGRQDAGPASFLASHQTCYKWDPLLQYGPELERLIETETLLQKDLREKGHSLYFEPAAVTNHVNVSRLSDLTRIEFHNYRAFAASRVHQGRWSWGHRLAYIAGSPVIPLVRGYRLVGPLRRAGLSRLRQLATLPTFLVALAVAAVGELLGYALGEGNSPARRISFELTRRRHLIEADRREIFGE